MKLILLLLIAFGAAVGFAAIAKDTNGYVRVHLDPYTVEVNVWVFIFAVLALFILLYLLFRLLSWIFMTKKRVGKWKQRKDELSAGKSMQKGYIDLIEGKWDSAEKRLVAKADKSPAPVLNYLAAAHAAQQNGEPSRRDEYLKKAFDKDPSSKVAVDLTQARMQFETGDLDAAKNTLTRLQFHVPKNEQVQRMLLAVNRERQDYAGVLQQLPKLKRLPNFTTEEAFTTECEACTHLLESASEQGIEAVEKFWNSLTRKQRQTPELVDQYAYELMEAGEEEKCELLLRKTLRKNWNSDLAYTYGLVQLDAARQLRLAEDWLNNHPQDPNLLLTLGRLAFRAEAWDKAKSYYQQAITAGASQEANRELGRLLEKLGESDKALEYYRSGLEQVLPAPKAPPIDDHIVDMAAYEHDTEEQVDDAKQAAGTDQTEDTVQVGDMGQADESKQVVDAGDRKQSTLAAGAEPTKA